jgi:hypothetical protein
MVSPGPLKRRHVLDLDAPDALERKKGANRQRESSASTGGHVGRKSCRARCPPPARVAFCSCALPPSAPAHCPLLQHALSSALPCVLPSALNRVSSSLVRQPPPLLADGKRRILLVDGKRILLALCSRTTLLLCSRTSLLLVRGYAPPLL